MCFKLDFLFLHLFDLALTDLIGNHFILKFFMDELKPDVVLVAVNVY